MVRQAHHERVSWRETVARRRHRAHPELVLDERAYNARRPLVMASMKWAMTPATRSGGSMNSMPER